MEDSDAKTEAPAFVYDTLPPLSFSDSNQSPPPTHEESHQYSVFRKEISDFPDDTTPVESATVDFFSLDVEGETTENGVEPVTPVVVASKKKSKKRKKDEEPRLESNWFSENSFSKIPMLQLHKEIVDFCDFLLPTQAEKAERDAAVESVSSVIKYIWPSCKVEVFGSYKTGLYLPTSDIDVVILESGLTNPQLGLRALSRALSQRGIAKNLLVIAKARVPIIKFVEKKSNIAFDLSFDMENGPKAAEFIQDAVSKLPPLRPLCLILKVFLQQRELNEVYSGGIGSYALLAMLIAFLKYLKDGRSAPEHNLGVLLVKFFDFYGRKLNTADVGISCKMGGSFFSKYNKGFLNRARPSLISIEDPQTPENDIGKSSFNYFQIRSAFAMALSTLTNTKAILSLGLSPTLNHRSHGGFLDGLFKGQNGQKGQSGLGTFLGQHKSQEAKKSQGHGKLLGQHDQKKTHETNSGLNGLGMFINNGEKKHRRKSEHKKKNKDGHGSGNESGSSSGSDSD